MAKIDWQQMQTAAERAEQARAEREQSALTVGQARRLARALGLSDEAFDALLEAPQPEQA